MVVVADFRIPGRSASSGVALTQNQLKLFFRQHDANNDGHLDKSELTQAFRRLGSYFPKYRAAQALRVADAGRDGYIDESELDALVNYAIRCGYALK